MTPGARDKRRDRPAFSAGPSPLPRLSFCSVLAAGRGESECTKWEAEVGEVQSGTPPCELVPLPAPPGCHCFPCAVTGPRREEESKGEQEGSAGAADADAAGTAGSAVAFCGDQENRTANSGNGGGGGSDEK